MIEKEQPHGGKLNILEKGETANPNGRPKKSWSRLNAKLVEKGFEPLTKLQLQEAYALLFSLDEETLSEIANDDTEPVAIRMLIQEMTQAQTSANAFKDMRDYLFGKANQSIDHTSGGDKINFSLGKLNDDQLVQLEVLQNAAKDE